MKSIKQKILYSVVGVVVAALLAGLGFTYAYVYRQMKDQIVSDNQIRLSQSAHLLEYISNDIINLTRGIVADEEVNALVAAQAYQSTAEEVSAVYSAVHRMQEYMSMRTFVQSIALVYRNGLVLWDKAPYDSYFFDIMQQPWYTEGRDGGERYRFSAPHEVVNLSTEETVISLIAMTVDPKQMQQASGEVIVNVRFKWLQNTIAADAETFDGFCWMRSDGDVLWQCGEIDPTAVVLPAAGQPAGAVQRVQNGYLISEYTQSNGWLLVSFVSNKSIAAKLIYLPILFVLVGLFCVAGIGLVIRPIIRHIVKPVNDLVGLMGEAGEGNLAVCADIGTNDEMAVLGEGFNSMVRQLDEYITLKMDNERQIRLQEYDLILARLNPHFIYNTLNTVVYLAKRDGSADSAEVASSLIVLLQDIIRISDKSVYSTLGQELETVRHYCAIQQHRYPGKFSLVVDVPEDLHMATVPKTILQPLVENALLHGIFPTGRAGEVQIGASLADETTLVLTVRDTGDGLDFEKVERILGGEREGAAARHVGLSSIAERIRYLYGEGYGLQFEHGAPSGTWVRVLLPWRHD